MAQVFCIRVPLDSFMNSATLSLLTEVMLFYGHKYRPSSLVFYFTKKSRKSQFPRIADRFSNNIRQSRRKSGCWEGAIASLDSQH